jgi:hypothetical protein
MSNCRLVPMASAAVVLCAAFVMCGPSQAEDQDKQYTVQIYNNSKAEIFPVLSTPTNDRDEWLQANFKVDNPKTSTKTFSHKRVYRIYAGAIKPGESATLTLPFYSHIKGSGENGEKPDQYVDWWNGGRIAIYDDKAAYNKYINDDKNNHVEIDQLSPTCNNCHIDLFWNETALPTNGPDQLLEYTFSGINPTTNPYKLLDYQEVDYDISYVDHVYLPVATEPKGVNNVGYIGSIQDVQQFRSVLFKFRNNYRWPTYKTGNASEIKLPGAYNAVEAFDRGGPPGMYNEPGYLPGAMFFKASNVYKYPGSEYDTGRQLYKLFSANYDNWLKICKQDYNPYLDPSHYPAIAKKIYGWVPWNENCSGGSAANDLSNTPGYSTEQYHNFTVTT